jgi:hypothetical protein
MFTLPSEKLKSEKRKKTHKKEFDSKYCAQKGFKKRHQVLYYQPNTVFKQYANS